MIADDDGPDVDDVQADFIQWQDVPASQPRTH